MSFTFISTRIKIKYNYNIIHINTEFVQNTKSFHHPDATLCAELANVTVDTKIFARQFYECYSVESRTIS